MKPIYDTSRFDVSSYTSPYLLERYVFDRQQFYYHQFLKGLLSKEDLSLYKVDTSHQLNRQTNSALYVLLIKKSDSLYEIIPDLNFNKPVYG